MTNYATLPTPELVDRFVSAATSLRLGPDGLPDAPLAVEVAVLTRLATVVDTRMAGNQATTDAERAVWRCADEWTCVMAASGNPSVRAAMGRRWIEAVAALPDTLPDETPRELIERHPTRHEHVHQWTAEEVAALPVCEVCDMPIIVGNPHIGCNAA